MLNILCLYCLNKASVRYQNVLPNEDSNLLFNIFLVKLLQQCLSSSIIFTIFFPLFHRDACTCSFESKRTSNLYICFFTEMCLTFAHLSKVRAFPKEWFYSIILKIIFSIDYYTVECCFFSPVQLLYTTKKGHYSPLFGDWGEFHSKPSASD